MGVSMTWKPYKPEHGKSFAAGSSLHKALKELFGEFPIIIDSSEIPKLQGIIACGYEECEELITALGDYDRIELEDCW